MPKVGAFQTNQKLELEFVRTTNCYGSDGCNTGPGMRLSFQIKKQNSQYKS